MVKVAVVILNWNGKPLLEQFLPQLIKLTPANVTIVVGDNHSSDQSLEFIQENFPQVRTLCNTENLGYAGGYNKILSQVEAEYYILLNSDVEVSPGWMEPIIRYLDLHTEVVAAQPKILSYYHKDTYEYAGAAGGFMDRFGYFFCRGRLFDTLEKDLGQYNTPYPIFWASGAAFFIRSRDFHEIGGFDSTLFAHMEEIDLCWRLQRAGKGIAFVPDGKVYHMGGQTLKLQNPQKTYLNFRNNLIIIYKNWDEASLGLTLICRFLLDFITWIYFLLTFKWNHAGAINRAHFDFLKGMKHYSPQKKNPSKAGFQKITSHLPGFYKKSVVWSYFIRSKKKFSELF